ncbi:GSCFA domain-containing protein, partial [Flavobacteriaceae bacterium]|nr:GSCFA domain-containing protein [Flavobacteriaceae bacterium]
MELQTKVPLSHLNFQIDYNAQILLLGSCFSDHIGALFSKHQFNTISNPFGIIFHPIPLASLIQRIVHKNYFTEDAFFFHQEQWHSYELHSSMGRTNLSEALRNANEILDLTHNFLNKASHVFITLGTAWGYRLNNTIVTNCHKQSASLFHKELASISLIENALEQIQAAMMYLNPDLKVVYTVSPVRHLKDGFTENSIGKAHLLAGIHAQKEKAKDSKSVSYFPSYEIVMDELRDYRFYKMDLIHPNELAI